jgi:hypothetical protein
MKFFLGIVVGILLSVFAADAGLRHVRGAIFGSHPDTSFCALYEEWNGASGFAVYGYDHGKPFRFRKQGR